MLLTVEILLFSLFISGLLIIATKQYETIPASKVNATIIDMRNMAREGKQAINKLSPFGTTYTINADGFSTILPFDNFTSNLVETQQIGNDVELKVYWQTVGNSQAYFYKKRLYNE